MNECLTNENNSIAKCQSLPVIVLGSGLKDTAELFFPRLCHVGATGCYHPG